MKLGLRFRAFERHPTGRAVLLGIGAFCIVIAPIVGLLPGPGGTPLFLLGLTMMLRYAHWTKRLYVRLKKRWPKQGKFADWGLRRGSAKRRAALAAERPPQQRGG